MSWDESPVKFSPSQGPDISELFKPLKPEEFFKDLKKSKHKKDKSLKKSHKEHKHEELFADDSSYSKNSHHSQEYSHFQESSFSSSKFNNEELSSSSSSVEKSVPKPNKKKSKVIPYNLLLPPQKVTQEDSHISNKLKNQLLKTKDQKLIKKDDISKKRQPPPPPPPPSSSKHHSARAPVLQKYNESSSTKQSKQSKPNTSNFNQKIFISKEKSKKTPLSSSSSSLHPFNRTAEKLLKEFKEEEQAILDRKKTTNSSIFDIANNSFYFPENSTFSIESFYSMQEVAMKTELMKYFNQPLDSIFPDNLFNSDS